MLKFALLALVTVASTSALAAPKTYQVTGEVTEVTDAKIIVIKGKEKFEMDRSPSTKVTGDLKKGGKVTVWYSMTAQEVEVKK